jgi:hypothetical protein
MAFNNIGNFTISPGQSYRLDWWSWSGGNGDQGAQYFSAHPFDPWHDGKLVMSEQNKVLGGDGHYYYGFRVTNEGPQFIHFSVQGGGFG